MKTFLKVFAAGFAAIGMLGVAAASDKPHNHKRSHAQHDHRINDAKDHSPRDRAHRARHNRDGGVSFSIVVGNDRYGRHGRYDRYDRSSRYDRYDRRHRYHDRRHRYRGHDARRVNREVFETRHRARIVLTEDVIRTRRGPRFVCNVTARGPEARYVSERRMRRIADRYCSHRARVNIYS